MRTPMIDNVRRMTPPEWREPITPPRPDYRAQTAPCQRWPDRRILAAVRFRHVGPLCGTTKPVLATADKEAL